MSTLIRLDAGTILRACVLSLVLLNSSPMLAQGPFQLPKAVQEASGLIQRGHYLAAIDVLQASPEKGSLLWQNLATVHSFAGNDWEALEAMDLARGARPTARLESSEALDQANPLNALDAITELARHRQVVIINEAHHVARHRVFTQQLLDRLAQAGFEYFAAEAFLADPQRIAERGYPANGDGFYLRESAFGNLVRHALRRKLKLVHYEMTPQPSLGDPAQDINRREAAQALNLVTRLFKQDPQARVLIHVGYNHAMEGKESYGNGAELKWMAQRLSEAINIDPLTIDQTLQTERSREEYGQPLWRYAVAKGLLDESKVFRLPSGEFVVDGSYQGRVDLQVFHPPTQRKQGRPTWLLEAGLKRTIGIPKGLLPGSGKHLVQVYNRGEDGDAIPVDQVVVISSEQQPALMVSPGDYLLKVADREGEEVGQTELKVR